MGGEGGALCHPNQAQSHRISGTPTRRDFLSGLLYAAVLLLLGFGTD
jgi:hypothetical protein